MPIYVHLCTCTYLQINGISQRFCITNKKIQCDREKQNDNENKSSRPRDLFIKRKLSWQSVGDLST